MLHPIGNGRGLDLLKVNTVLARRRQAMLRRSPKDFRNALLIDADGEAKSFESTLDHWQRADFEALDMGWMRVVGLHNENSCRRGYLERPRGHSKTTDLACAALWALYASPRKIIGVAGAAAQKQAKFLRDGIDTIVRLNPWIGDEISVHNLLVVNERTGSEFKILAANESTNYGETPDFVISDELTHWPNEGLWTALFSAAAKRSKCMVVVIANAGIGQGISWHWHAREKARLDPAWYFHSLKGPEASWITPENLEEQRRHLSPLAFKRLWLNIWLTNVGDALDMDAVYRAICLDGPSEYNPFDYAIGGLDMGLAHDHAAFVVFGINVGLKKLRLLHAVRFDPRNFENGRISFNTVEQHIIATCRRLKVEGIAYDPWQAEHLAENLRNNGIITWGFPSTPANAKRMAVELMDSVNHDWLELYREDSLLTDLARLNIVNRPLGYKIEAPRDEDGHCDMATAMVLALPFARDALAQYGGIT